MGMGAAGQRNLGTGSGKGSVTTGANQPGQTPQIGAGKGFNVPRPMNTQPQPAGKGFNVPRPMNTQPQPAGKGFNPQNVGQQPTNLIPALRDLNQTYLGQNPAGKGIGGVAQPRGTLVGFGPTDMPIYSNDPNAVPYTGPTMGGYMVNGVPAQRPQQPRPVSGFEGTPGTWEKMQLDAMARANAAKNLGIPDIAMQARPGTQQPARPVNIPTQAGLAGLAGLANKLRG